jgi:translation initiation factor IF-1
MPDDKEKFVGVVDSARGNGFFLIKFRIDNEDKYVLCTLSGKMRTNNIKIVEGDKVQIDVDPFDMKKGRIVFRYQRK